MFAAQQLRTSQKTIPTVKNTVSQTLTEKDNTKVPENKEMIGLKRSSSKNTARISRFAELRNLSLPMPRPNQNLQLFPPIQ